MHTGWLGRDRCLARGGEAGERVKARFGENFNCDGARWWAVKRVFARLKLGGRSGTRPDGHRLSSGTKIGVKPSPGGAGSFRSSSP